MIINFSQHSEPEISFAHRYNPEDINLNDETAEVSGQIEVHGKAVRNLKLARLTGKLQGNLEIACNRCLQPIDFDLNAAFDVDFVTLEDYGSANSEAELKNADLTTSVYNGEQIDLDEVVREQILLNLPMTQLCRESCAGLCLNCGANKNINPCGCDDNKNDLRWSALKELKNK